MCETNGVATIVAGPPSPLTLTSTEPIVQKIKEDQGPPSPKTPTTPKSPTSQIPDISCAGKWPNKADAYRIEDVIGKSQLNLINLIKINLI